MMGCPKCCGETQVVDSRERDDGSVWRRRRCKSCGHLFHTSETVVPHKRKKRGETDEQGIR